MHIKFYAIAYIFTANMNYTTHNLYIQYHIISSFISYTKIALGASHHAIPYVLPMDESSR